MSTINVVTPEHAFRTLCNRLEGDEYADPIVRAAWRDLVEGIAAGKDLPLAWQRLTAAQAAQRADVPLKSFTGLVTKGYGPQLGGRDSIGRQYWTAEAVDVWRAKREARGQ